MKTTRRGFFGIVAGIFAGASVAKAAPAPIAAPAAFYGGRVEYMDTDSVVFRGPIPMDVRSGYPHDRLRIAQKFHMNSMYGKFSARL